MAVSKPRVVTRGSKARPSVKKSGGGLGKVDKAAAKQKGDRLWLSIGDGDSAVARVLDVDADFKDCYVHRVPFERDNGSTYHVDVPCLDQEEDGTPCPGCADEIDRRYKFFCNVIARDWKDPDAPKSTRAKDTLCILSGGITLAKMLNKKHQKFGLQNRDIEIEREGTRFDTKYEVEWAEDQNTPLTPADKKLAEGKHDLTRYTKPPSYEEFYVAPRDRNNNRGDDPDYEESTKRASPFKGERKKSSTTSRSGSGSRTTARSKSSESTDKPKTGLAALRAKKAQEGKSSAGKKTVVRRKAR